MSFDIMVFLLLLILWLNNIQKKIPSNYYCQLMLHILITTIEIIVFLISQKSEQDAEGCEHT